MKTNLQYIFDKITRKNVEGAKWKDLNRAALIDLCIEIGARDRGLSISAKIAGFLADTMMASRTAGRAEICRLRACLSYDKCSVAPGETALVPQS